MDVTLVYVDGCPDWRLPDDRLRAAPAQAGAPAVEQLPAGLR